MILADCSSSMRGEPITQLLAKLAKIWPGLRGAIILSFASETNEVESPECLPEPSGGTALDIALQRVKQYQPFELLIISDGEPDDAEKAANLARDLPCCIQTLFVGDERRSPEAVAFMHKLATDNGGRSLSRQVTDIAFESTVRDLLGLPAPLSL